MLVDGSRVLQRFGEDTGTLQMFPWLDLLLWSSLLAIHRIVGVVTAWGPATWSGRAPPRINALDLHDNNLDRFPLHGPSNLIPAIQRGRTAKYQPGTLLPSVSSPYPFLTKYLVQRPSSFASDPLSGSDKTFLRTLFLQSQDNGDYTPSTGRICPSRKAFVTASAITKPSNTPSAFW